MAPQSQEKQPKKKANWLQWITLGMFMLIGAAAGIFMMITIEELVGKDAEMKQVLLLLGVMLIGMYVLMFLHIVLHEGGHLVFGLLTGYKFVSFRIGSLILLKNEQGYRLRKLRLGGTGGQCLMAPPPMVDGKMPNVLYNLGGCLMNLLVGILCLVIALLLPVPSIGRTMLYISAVIGVIYALMNGLPFSGDLDNDGRNAMFLGKNPEALKAFRTQLVLNQYNVEGMRLKDMPEADFYWPDQESRQNSLVAAVAIFYANRLMDAHDFDECANRLDELLCEGGAKLPGLYRSLVVCDRIYLHLLSGEKEAAVQLMDKQQMQYMKALKGQPAIHRTEIVYALLAEGDAAKAEKAQAAFDKMAKNYPHQAEIDGEGELIALARDKAAQTEGENQ